MTAKNLDNNGRWRNVTIGFRVTKEENDAINEIVALSGYSKQEYITNKLLNRDVIVMKNPRVYKALREKMIAIHTELQRISNASECSKELIETIKLIAKIYVKMGMED